MDLTEEERAVLRNAHWPIEPPRYDDRFKTHARIEEAVERIIDARRLDLDLVRTVLLDYLTEQTDLNTPSFHAEMLTTRLDRAFRDKGSDHEPVKARFRIVGAS